MTPRRRLGFGLSPGGTFGPDIYHDRGAHPELGREECQSQGLAKFMRECSRVRTLGPSLPLRVTMKRPWEKALLGRGGPYFCACVQGRRQQYAANNQPCVQVLSGRNRGCQCGSVVLYSPAPARKSGSGATQALRLKKLSHLVKRSPADVELAHFIEKERNHGPYFGGSEPDY